MVGALHIRKVGKTAHTDFISIIEYRQLLGKHLDFYVKNIINQDPDHAFYLTGTADSATGTEAVNAKLSKRRVETVRKLIMDKYGISSDRLIIKDAKVSNKFSDPRLDRSVIIEH